MDFSPFPGGERGGGKGARQGRFSGLAGSPRLARSPGAARPLPCRCSRVPPRIVEAPRNRRGSPGCFSRSPARGRFRFARFRVRRPLAARGSACSGRCRCRCRCSCFRTVVLSFSRGDFLSVESLIPFFAAAPITPKSMVRLDYGARFGARFCCLRSEAVRSRGLFARSDRRSSCGRDDARRWALTRPPRLRGGTGGAKGPLPLPPHGIRPIM